MTKGERAVGVLTLVVIGVIVANVLTHHKRAAGVLGTLTGWSGKALGLLEGLQLPVGSGSLDGGTGSGSGCATPAGLVTEGGVTLVKAAMAAFRSAQKAAGGRIQVTSSYRSCAQQEAACQSVCGNSQGCPSGCAPPGQSYHQRGRAVDVSNYAFAAPYLKAHGWCHPLPKTDAGHFSFGGCG